MQAVGHALNEHLTFSILNPTDMFSVGSTSGVVQVSLGVRLFGETFVSSFSQKMGKEYLAELAQYNTSGQF